MSFLTPRGTDMKCPRRATGPNLYTQFARERLIFQVRIRHLFFRVLRNSGQDPHLSAP